MRVLHLEGALRVTAQQLHLDLHDGSGPFLLLVHGFLSSRAQWTPNLDALREVARPVVVELLGHARSPAPDDPAAYTPSSYVETFERIRNGLGADRWYVCGQSLGAALTLRYTLDHPDAVIAQVFTNSNSALAEADWGERIIPALEAQARSFRTRGRAAIDEHPLNAARSTRLSPEIRAAMSADCDLHSPEGLALTGLHTVPTSSVRERMRDNAVPTLLVVGERETRFAEHRRYAEHEIPLLEVCALDGGHAVNLDAADQFNAAVTAFLRKHPA
jgi:pimeloyl-ACP methyl ester carboxylesterase